MLKIKLEIFSCLALKFAVLIFVGACIFPSNLLSQQRRTTMLVGDVLNFELPNFDDATGFKEWEVFGDKATYIGENKIDVSKMRLHLFEATREPKLKAKITSATASINPTTKQVLSKSKLFVEAPSFDMRGREWHWDGVKKLVKVFNDVEIDFKAGQSKSKEGFSFSKTRAFSVSASLDHGGKANIFQLEKNVRVENPHMKIACDKMRVDSSKDTSGAREILAEGNVKINVDKREAKSGRARVLPAKETVLLSDYPSILDESSKAVLSGNTILLEKNTKRLTVESSKRVLARATLLHNQQTIIISADNIVLRELDKNNEFDFVGNVKVVSPDFTAHCDKLKAFATTGNNAGSVEKIEGYGNVKFSNENGDAYADNLEIFPLKEEVLLTNRARLVDAKRGTKLKSHLIIFSRKTNSAVALSKTNDKKSFVNLEINEELTADGKSKRAKYPTRVKSRVLNFRRDQDKLFFTFVNEVSITSNDSHIKCGKMDVFAKSAKQGSANVEKIVAMDSVEMNQKNYEAIAEIATVYPRVEVKTDAKKTAHRYVELLTSPSNPAVRPTVILPPFGNLGLDTALSSNSQSKTKIVSDKQWFVAAGSDAETDKYFFEGNVKISGTQMEGSCQKVEIRMRAPRKGARKEISQIVMLDDVRAHQGFKDLECGRADFYVDEQMAVLSENPSVINRQDNSRVEGPRIIYNVGKKRITVDSAEAERRGKKQQERATVFLPSLENIKKPEKEQGQAQPKK